MIHAHLSLLLINTAKKFMRSSAKSAICHCIVRKDCLISTSQGFGGGVMWYSLRPLSCGRPRSKALCRWSNPTTLLPPGISCLSNSRRDNLGTAIAPGRHRFDRRSEHVRTHDTARSVSFVSHSRPDRVQRKVHRTIGQRVSPKPRVTEEVRRD